MLFKLTRRLFHYHHNPASYYYGAPQMSVTCKAIKEQEKVIADELQSLQNKTKNGAMNDEIECDMQLLAQLQEEEEKLKQVNK